MVNRTTRKRKQNKGNKYNNTKRKPKHLGKPKPKQQSNFKIETQFKSSSWK